MIRLGTVAAIGFDGLEPGELLGLYRQLGCKVVQAYRNQERGVSFNEMSDAIAAGGMPCDSLHGVFGEQFDPSSPDEQARRFRRRYLQAGGRALQPTRRETGSGALLQYPRVGHIA